MASSRAQRHEALIEEVQQGISDRLDDGLRFWVRYTRSGLCQWLRTAHVASTDGTPFPSATLPPPPSSVAKSKSGKQHRPQEPSAVRSDERTISSANSRPSPVDSQILEISRSCGAPGSEVWVLLGRHPRNVRFEAAFGDTKVTNVRSLASNVIAVCVPHGLHPGQTALQLMAWPTSSSRSRKSSPAPVSAVCSMEFEVLPEEGP